MARILVIDDDPAVCATIEAVLAHAGHAATVAKDGRAGIAACQAGAFDVVMVDLFMPGMEGLETIRALRAQAPQMPILAMSGFMARQDQPAPDYLSMANKLGATTTLAKPFRPQQLLRAVETCLTARGG
jgi:CheY-like chemotaxis protein